MTKKPLITTTAAAAVALIFTLLPVTVIVSSASPPPAAPTACIIGSGIGGSSVAHFLRRYDDTQKIGQIRMFERHGWVGGRMATITVAGETFEAGASILHPKNYHALEFTKLLNLTIKKPPSSMSGLSLGIWDGHRFVFKTYTSNSKIPIVQICVSLANSIKMFVRYGLSLFRMTYFVQVFSFFSDCLFFHAHDECTNR